MTFICTSKSLAWQNLTFLPFGLNSPCPPSVELQSLPDRVKDVGRDGQVPQGQEPGSGRVRVRGTTQPG